MKKVNELNNGVHVLYKKLGETPLEIISRLKTENPEYENVPMTYAGRLDPMAEGVLLVLSGDTVHKKEEYLGLDKTYIIEMLWGFETDTLDLLGRVVKSKMSEIKSEEMVNILKESVGKFEQSYPAYSSKPVNGKPLFEWAREGKISEIEIPKHEVEIYSIKHLSRKMISKSDLLSEIQEKIKKVSGDFRQEDILKSWQMVLDDSTEVEFTLDKMEMSVSSGFYVRQFVHDLANNLGSSAVTFHIKRTKVGEYSV